MQTHTHTHTHIYTHTLKPLSAFSCTCYSSCLHRHTPTHTLNPVSAYCSMHCKQPVGLSPRAPRLMECVKPIGFVMPGYKHLHQTCRCVCVAACVSVCVPVSVCVYVHVCVSSPGASVLNHSLKFSGKTVGHFAVMDLMSQTTCWPEAITVKRCEPKELSEARQWR